MTGATQKLNLFYEQPDPDRWFRLDRYPRRIIRRLVRGRPRRGGHDLVFYNLLAGLDRLNASYRVNGYSYIRRHSTELACVIGKPHVVDKLPRSTPILFGAAQFSHPNEEPGFFEHRPNIRLILVPGEWVRRMWKPYFGNRVQAWATGIDTDKWAPQTREKDLDFVVYDKIYRDRHNLEQTLVFSVLSELERRGFAFRTLRYGGYEEAEYHQLLGRTHAMIFLCEHETQGIAYQQALSSGVPLLTYDRGGFWTDPNFYPHIAEFEPVTSVPYWDERCGVKFANAEEFPSMLDQFLSRLSGFDPRRYILDNLTLEICARRYLEFVRELGVGR